MKVGGEQNLGPGQVASKFDLGSVLKLSHSVNHQCYTLVAGSCKCAAASQCSTFLCIISYNAVFSNENRRGLRS